MIISIIIIISRTISITVTTTIRQVNAICNYMTVSVMSYLLILVLLLVLVLFFHNLIINYMIFMK